MKYWLSAQNGGCESPRFKFCHSNFLKYLVVIIESLSSKVFALYMLFFRFTAYESE